MTRRPLRTLLVIMGFVLASRAVSARATEARWEISSSEKLDAAAFLNAISDNPRFNQSWKELRAVWREKISGDSLAQAAFLDWSGRGIQLAYLLSALPENDLEGTLHRFEHPQEMLSAIEQGLDEPAYRGDFEDLQNHTGEVQALFRFLLKNGFASMRSSEYGPVLARTRADLEQQLRRITVAEYADQLELFTGKKVPGRALRIYVLAFARPLSFQLSGYAIAWASDTENFAWLLTHEFLHKYNPSALVLELQSQLARKDSFYAEAYARIYTEFDEGKEEEFVEAAARTIVWKMHLSPAVRILRGMKFLYYSATSGRGDVPLAAILFDTLRQCVPVPGSFDYNAFIEGAFASGRIAPGNVKALYLEAVKPVAGMAGMVVRPGDRGARVEKIFPGRPAEKAGISEGDILLEANGTSLAGKNQEEILDFLAGEKGAAIDILLGHAAGKRNLRMVLE